MRRQLESALQNLGTSQEQKQRAGLPRTSWDPVKRRGRTSAPRNRELDLRKTWEKVTCRATLLGKSGINSISPRLREVFTSSWVLGPKGSWVCSLTQDNCCTRLQRNCNNTQVYMMQPGPHYIAVKPLPKFSVPVTIWRWEGKHLNLIK